MTDSELNELVARKLGWKRSMEWDHDTFSSSSLPPAYSTSLEAAWEIVEHLKENFSLDRWERKERSGMTMEEQKIWRVGIRTGPYESLEVYDDNPARAICLAFLKLP